MVCPECNGTGETVYFVEVDRDENRVTCEKKKGICRTCKGSGEKPMTKADRIRAMSDEELARWLAKTQIANVYEALTIAHIPFEQPINMQEETEKECLEWLEQPVEDE